MSRTNAEQLADAVKQIETSVNIIEELVAHAYASADFSFVDQFRDRRGATLPEAGLITTALVKRMQGRLNVLANVLYLREVESTKDIVDWRGMAKAGRRVEAITMMRSFVGSVAFDVTDARDVVDAYLEHEF